MASPLLMLASKEPRTTSITTRDHHHQENRADKSRGKKAAKSKSPAKKKQPQRGMGVAQLERLRVQEGWKKLMEIDPVVHNLNQQQQQQHISQSFAPPSFGSPLICNGGNGSGLNRGFVGFSGGSTGGGSGSSGFDRYWDPRFGKNNVLLESNHLKELSSIPNMQCGFDLDPCGSVQYFKKKRTHNENPAFMEASPMMNNRCNFNGLDLGTNANFFGDQNSMNFNNAATSTRIGVPNKGVEIKAVHRNENVEGGSNVLMEYDFLPSDNKSAFYCQNEDHSGFASNSDTTIDLSLKL